MDQLGAGMVITGGASQLKNIDIFLKENLNMPVRKASAKKTFINNYPELANDPSLTQALGLLLSGWENCEEQIVEPLLQEEEAVKEEVKPKPAKKPKNSGRKKSGEFFSKVESMFGRIFDDEDDTN